MLVDTTEGPVPLSRLLPAAFGTEDLGSRRDGGAQPPASAGENGAGHPQRAAASRGVPEA